MMVIQLNFSTLEQVAGLNGLQVNVRASPYNVLLRCQGNVSLLEVAANFLWLTESCV